MLFYTIIPSPLSYPLSHNISLTFHTCTQFMHTSVIGIEREGAIAVACVGSFLMILISICMWRWCCVPDSYEDGSLLSDHPLAYWNRSLVPMRRLKSAPPSSTTWLGRCIASVSMNSVLVLPTDEANNDVDSVPSSSRTIVRRYSFRNERERYYYDPSSHRIAAQTLRRVGAEM